ncbi:hypothetical protein NEUTE1DRAFT_38602 [Neurospora tetrasperma FGSC 2508]|uniref:Uncharacterized protein n=1 Tax=Neurospora tetrasperma (strain FGSC 2508 / ATCC MYA-4615 / P0657) TaxID=510951 RepID=F8MIJ2_NEUT8|nr:uncharacterized protein NEUTE1DRAFT_38602 [Neurospora tetrasperma FGSC 2508]EGO59793.1 hypothetical protein NEUTE1DRAFT_38602 [Neurospora tetrasperma FGSC 2508]EGZ73941.1 hypothetical protein NEUTE2DRAFT_62157 [Neurospora tetrasperma FGSC 2509]
MNTLVTGAAFGAALTVSGVYQPSVIVSQLKFENWHMIQAFLTAAASSAALVHLLQTLSPTTFPLPPRSYSSISLFSRYDGNLLGGILLGTGMMLSGACPGTVLAQIGTGVRSGFYALEGGIIGGIVFTGFAEAAAKASGNGEESKELTKTVYENLGVSRSSVLVAFEAICASVVVSTALWTSVGPEAKISPVVGGLCIAGAQLLSLLLRKNLVGTSTSFEEVGDWFWGIFKGKTLPQRYNNLLFVSGCVLGAKLLTVAYPALGQVTEVAVSPVAAGLGGFLMIIGSRMAGGCTSGHGISGISLLSTSSFLTIGAAFGAGALLGLMRG